MRVEVTGVSKGKRGVALATTSLAFGDDAARLAVAETEQRPTVLGLIASGRMRPDTGSVTIDGAIDGSALRRRVALIDAPDVSEPAPNVTVFGVVAEELMFAGKPSSPRAVLDWLTSHDVRELSRIPIADIAPAERVRLLLELAVLRPNVDGVVLVSPDRHGGDPHAWWRIAESFAARGYSILVIAGASSGAVLSPHATRAEIQEVTA